MNSTQYLQPQDVVRHHVRYTPTRLAGITETAGEFDVEAEHVNGRVFRVATGRTRWDRRGYDIRITPTRLLGWPHNTLYGTDELPEAIERLNRDRLDGILNGGTS